MKNPPVILSEFVLQRIIAIFGIKLGLSPEYASVLAQVHYQDAAVHAWVTFFQVNCLQCRYDVETCAFFQPATWPAGQDASTVRKANCQMVETGRWKLCPVRELAIHE